MQRVTDTAPYCFHPPSFLTTCIESFTIQHNQKKGAMTSILPVRAIFTLRKAIIRLR